MRVVIVEDEELLAQELENNIRKIAPDALIIGKFTCIKDTVEFIADNQVDLAFFDIHLQDGQSFSILEKVKVSFPIIFTTAYDQYAVKAFRNNGIDYLLKPIDPLELQTAIGKYRESSKTTTNQSISHKIEQLLLDRRDFKERFLFSAGKVIVPISVDDIAYFMADGKYAWVVTLEGKRFYEELSLINLEKELDPRKFFRINRKFFISYKSIKELCPYGKGKVKVLLTPMPDSDELQISEARLREFKAWLEK